MTDSVTSGTITFDDFLKVDIRSGVITKSETVSKSDKLLKLEVYLGPEIGHRTIMAGIAKSYDEGALVGIRCLVVVNLVPRKMMGIESHGMLLAGGLEDGTVMLAACNASTLGTRIG